MISDDLFFTSLSDRNGISLLLTIYRSDRLVLRDELIRTLRYPQRGVINFTGRAEADGLIDIIVEERPRRTTYLRCTDLGFRVSKMVSTACIEVYGTDDVREKSVNMMHADPVLRFILNNPGCSLSGLREIKTAAKRLKVLLEAMESEGLIEMAKAGTPWGIHLTHSGTRIADALEEAYRMIESNRPEFVLERESARFAEEHPEYVGFTDESQSEVLAEGRAVALLELADADPDDKRGRRIADAVVARLLRQSGFGSVCDAWARMDH